MQSFAHAQAQLPDKLTETRTLLDMGGVRVERHPGNLVVKYGNRVNAADREALAYAGSLGLPVPRLHDLPPPPNLDATKDDAGGENGCIWMDYVDGDVLEDVWPQMTPGQKVDIALQLRDILTAMRQQDPTTGVIESCGGGAITDRIVYGTREGGPFADEAAFNAFQLDLLHPPTPKEVRDALTQALHQRSTHRVVFTHGDLTQHNIIVKDNCIQALLDWEFSGWYPEHWEIIKFVDLSPKHRYWRSCAQYILPEKYLDDLVVFQALRRWQKQF